MVYKYWNIPRDCELGKNKGEVLLLFFTGSTQKLLISNSLKFLLLNYWTDFFHIFRKFYIKFTEVYVGILISPINILQFANSKVSQAKNKGIHVQWY